ncbi:glutaminase family protein [Flavivirga sp. 57AJ16]|uniref:glutaminase family protein n=1 Tax=Flavivirga sp. 57AJ16 TaxID=3025307 RepID=UPI0023654D5D|nr:glutaminase family protein [Flavivirga sp. 57AJ16]MDD7884751.1 DUF4965 domain-containing protein [Flavivirga sp. 57AJ16]
MRLSKHIKTLSILLLIIGTTTLYAQEKLRAPAYPLVTHNPNFSIWSMDSELNGSATQHWTEQDHSLLGILKVDNEYYRFLGAETKIYETILAASDEIDYQADYTESKPDFGWEKINYNSSHWKKGAAPFSNETSDAKTIWKSNNLWYRRVFDLDNKNLKNLYLKLRHDDNVVVYLNGNKIYETEGWLHRYKYIPINQNIIKKLKSKDNVLAIHVKNTAGGQWLDAGLVTEAPSMQNVEIKKAKQTNVVLNANQTIYRFDCDNVTLTATFTSPLLLDDLDVMSRPISYLSVKVKSKDNKAHQTKLYIGASSNMAVYTPQQEVVATKYTQSNLNILKAGTVEQPVLQKKSDDMRVDWGYVYLSAPATTSKHYISAANTALLPFVSNDKINTKTEITGKNLVLNTITDLGSVSTKETETVLMLGYDEVYTINYFGSKLKPWFKKQGISMDGALATAADDYKSIIKRVETFDKKIYEDCLNAGGKKYADLCILAYRQAIAAHTLVESPEGEILFLSKENNSGGFINTVDVTYPSAPLFLIYNPDLLKGMLNGIFYYSEKSGKWSKPYPTHDLGVYPIATGHIYGEDMPVEEAGNMIILTAAIAQQEGHAEYAKKHWETLTTWANYLTKEGFDPGNQLCTDDFAGHLARNANLSVKAIMGIASYGKLAGMLGKKQVEKNYIAIAKKLAKDWKKIDADGNHYSLAFEAKGTWSQKYNLVWDDILDLNIFSKDIIKKEIKYYLTKQNKYGLPLDSRKTYTKSDWIVWTATLAENEADFKALINPMWKYANETPDRVPISDFHETTNAKRINFKGRSVVGGYFIKLLKVMKK